MTIAVDDYQTRVTGRPEIVERRDPVIWGSSQDPEAVSYTHLTLPTIYSV